MQSLPGAEQGNKAPAAASWPKTFRLDDSALAKLTPVGSIMDEDSGRAAINLPKMSGRYITVKWTPATQQDTAFSVAEISASGGNKNASLIASSASSARREEVAFDGKAVLEGRDFGEAKDAKEVPSDAPPAEGPPITLPDPPPFTFVPEVSP